MIGSIIASVAGSAASSLLGGGSRRQQTLPAKFSTRQAPFRRRVENVMEPDTQGLEKLPEESASVGTIQTLINRHEAMLNAVDAGAAGSLSSGGIGRYNY
jgi:hypothetical protein